MTVAQKTALTALAMDAEGVLYSSGTHRISTLRALEAAGLVTLEWFFHTYTKANHRTSTARRYYAKECGARLTDAGRAAL